MSLRSFYIICGLMICLHQFSVNGSPQLHLRKLYGTAGDLRSKKDDIAIPQADEDVLELEHLKEKTNFDNADNSAETDSDVSDDTSNMGTVIDNTFEESVNPEDPLPILEKQLELEAAKLNINNNEKDDDENNGGIILPGQLEREEEVIVQHRPPHLPSFAKPQAQQHLKKPTEPETNGQQTNNEQFNQDINEMNEKSPSPAKTAETLLKRAESSFDMAQYVFWTGDEAGVARAVEEYIDQGLMSRENALKFLREIRMGVEYLQQSYDHRVFAEQKKNKNSDLPKTTHHQSKRVAQNNFMELQEKHLPKLQKLHRHPVQQPHTLQKLENQPIKSNLQKTFDEIPSLLRLREMTNEQRKENINNDEDDMAGRARLADFLYTEYTLEEVIYQLAKVMFSQSLTHDSVQSQKALKRLTTFLETEGELGRISPLLQKKILDVLLAALSDTLANHPELLQAARANLGKTFHQMQDNSFESIMTR